VAVTLPAAAADPGNAAVAIAATTASDNAPTTDRRTDLMAPPDHQLVKLTKDDRNVGPATNKKQDLRI
jgi:hypothetical protein